MWQLFPRLDIEEGSTMEKLTEFVSKSFDKDTLVKGNDKGSHLLLNLSLTSVAALVTPVTPVNPVSPSSLASVPPPVNSSGSESSFAGKDSLCGTGQTDVNHGTSSSTTTATSATTTTTTTTSSSSSTSSSSASYSGSSLSSRISSPSSTSPADLCAVTTSSRAVSGQVIKMEQTSSEKHDRKCGS